MSFLKQLLTPFVEFDENKKKELAKKNNAAPTSNPRTEPPGAENAEHPLITGSGSGADMNDQVPTYSPAGTIAGPLPEHEQYFEKLIDASFSGKLLLDKNAVKNYLEKISYDSLLEIIFHHLDENLPAKPA